MIDVNVTRVNDGFRVLLKSLAPYVATELQAEYGGQWWRRILEKLYPEQKRNLPSQGDDETFVNSLDVYLCLLLLDLYWNEIFRKKLATDNRTWAKELVGTRNRLAHIGSEDITEDDAWRALDTMARLCENIDAKKAAEIRALSRKARYGSLEGSTANTSNVAPPPTNIKPTIENHSGLPSWREIIEPHPDVARGEYRNAEFAADLAQVARGEGAAEYSDPVEFFARTYLTSGMKGLLGEALARVTRRGGEPVIQLKTAFGGGKTHSMLALYHLFRGKAPLEQIPSIRSLLDELGIQEAPTTHVAVLVGTALDPSKAKRPPDLPGVTVNTLWGELAYQLAISTKNPKLYEHVREADKKGVSPGSEALTRLFDEAGSCLVLIDELVAYARRVHGVNGLPGGSFDNIITFVQAISEAARASKSSIVVASIPESDIEVGGEAGKLALAAIEHTFGRMESIWKPVAANEGFEVVRRRLFLDCKNPAGRDLVCAKFAEMYAENPTDFPVETRELEYRKRLAACYPIHPEVFDRLYEDWATLERFQRTRGVLRLMAAVIHELWMNNDQSLLIQPGALPLDTPSTRDELTRYLPETWNSIVDREVDGKRSAPFLQDQKNPRYAQLVASRRLARAIMLGSAPPVKKQTARGIEASRVRLGVVQPGEPISVFNDALNSLRNNLAYLYSNQSADRFWYDTRPTLRKTAEDRANQIPAIDVEYEIEERLKARCKKVPPLAGVHICPTATKDVPDEQSSRLVVLGTKYPYTYQKDDCEALKYCRDILEWRGDFPRIQKNTLVFLGADQKALQALEQGVRQYLAWKSIEQDSQDLDLSPSQDREVRNALKRCDETVEARLNEAWCWLITPTHDSKDKNKIDWQTSKLPSSNEAIMAKAVKKLMQEQSLIERWGPVNLIVEPDNVLWRNQEYLKISDLWDNLTKYLYCPRLTNFSVLADMIREGVFNSDEYFAYAAGFDGDRFIDLKYNRNIDVDKNGYLVKKAAARAQIEKERLEAEEKAKEEAGRGQQTEGVGSAGDGQGTWVGEDSGGYKGSGNPDPTIIDIKPTPPEPAKSKRFYMDVELNLTRINYEVPRIVAEILNHVNSEGLLKITLEAHARSDEGFEPDTERAVLENCRSLGIKSFGFEKE